MDRCINSGFVLISVQLLDRELYHFCSRCTGCTSVYNSTYKQANFDSLFRVIKRVVFDLYLQNTFAFRTLNQSKS